MKKSVKTEKKLVLAKETVRELGAANLVQALGGTSEEANSMSSATCGTS